MLHVDAVKAFNDNYLWVLHEEGQSAACVVDPGAAEPVLRHLAAKGLQLAAILVTHHHADHIGGIDQLLRQTSVPGVNVPVYGPATARIPQVTHPVQEGSTLELLGHRFEVLEVPGHTLEHVAYVATSADDRVQLFCGDTLFAAGCGRMFEGTPAMMHHSLQKLAALPAQTLVYCAHEYTMANLRFATAVMPDNGELQERVREEQAKRDRGLATAPSLLGMELKTNPFLRCAEAEVVRAAAAQQPEAALDPASVFGVLRRWKDEF